MVAGIIHRRLNTRSLVSRIIALRYGRFALLYILERMATTFVALLSSSSRQCHSSHRP